MTAVSRTGEEEHAWWKEAIVYQIWPQSFCDSNNDGIGDIKGIISKLDYIKDLGVDVVWLSPIYKSPQNDMGYDISDYKDIHPPYGSLSDVETLIAELHKRGMKLMMDLVVNHTSDQHAWFQESRSSRDNPKRDWYIWRDPKYDEKGQRQPPNNWLAVFRGGPAWTWDEKTQQYYLRLYTPEQPDLNWENAETRQAVYDVMHFWLKRGVSGFRMDVIAFISKVPGLPDASINEPGNVLQPAHEHYAAGPRVHEFLQEMHREVLSHYDHITVGECPFIHDTGVLAEFVNKDKKELQMIFTFEHMDIDSGLSTPFAPRKWKLTDFKRVISKYQTDMPEKGGWNSLYLENHDQARSVNRFGNPSPEYRDISSKMLALFHCTLSGTVYVYQGQEFGMGNVPKSWGIEEYPDIATKTYWDEVYAERSAKQGTDKPDMSDVLAGLQLKARDNARTPVQWDGESRNAGFSSDENAKPWMRMNEEDSKKYNVKSEQADGNSILKFWQKALAFRKANPATTYGVYRVLDEPNESLYIYTKQHASETLLVIVNFTQKNVEWQLPEGKHKRLFGNYEETKAIEEGTVVLRPYEAVVLKTGD